MNLENVWQLLAPYRFSWLAVVFFTTAALAYLRGQWLLAGSGKAVNPWRATAFWLGLALCYIVLHTRFDYYSQYMFFIHRGQHLILHHLGPMLVALAAPWPVLATGFPDGHLKRGLAGILRSWPVQAAYRCIQYPAIAAFLFAGLIYFWLWPQVHFDAMLSQSLYLLMNWSMFLDGLLFWWLMLDPRDPDQSGTLGLGKRILIIWLVTIPQLILGAFITFSPSSLYDIYAICGRAWPIAPQDDQVLGGLLTWIPPGMMGAVGVLILLSRLLHERNTTPVPGIRSAEEV